MTVATELLKINIGCWDTRLPGWKSLDIRPEVKPDFVADMGYLPFEKNTVAEIYASNCAEHVSHTETLAVLKEWHRVLVPGGKLWLSVPDFDVVMRYYPTHGLTPYLINLLYGEQNGKYAFHHICFTWANLRELLDQAGFQSAERLLELPYGVKDASRLVDTLTGESVAINAEVTK